MTIDAGYVLIIEDDRDVGEGMAILLDDYGYESKVVSNGREALAFLRCSSPPCLMLVDLMMPDMGGEEFNAAKLRDPALAGIPVCVVTAFDLQGPHPPGVAAVVRKPFDPKALVSLVERHRRVN
jgi:CheY-like chemotaxis protein